MTRGRDPIRELIRKYGKRGSKVEESLKDKMVEIVFSEENPSEPWYVPAEMFRKLEMKQLQYEMGETDRG